MAEKLSFEALKSGLMALGITDEKAIAKTAKANGVEVPAKGPVERFTLTDTATGKVLVVRSPSGKGKPRQINPAELADSLAEARRKVADLEEAESYLQENGVL